MTLPDPKDPVASRAADQCCLCIVFATIGSLFWYLIWISASANACNNSTVVPESRAADSATVAISTGLS